MFTNSELHYLRGTNEYQQRMFDEEYLEFLRGLRLPDYHVGRKGSDLEVDFSGSWADWETIALRGGRHQTSRGLPVSVAAERRA